MVSSSAPQSYTPPSMSEYCVLKIFVKSCSVFLFANNGSAFAA
jgi:hypothetical protein